MRRPKWFEALGSAARANYSSSRRYSMPIVDATLVGRTRKLRRFANV
jgi:hypothetical protein